MCCKSGWKKAEEIGRSYSAAEVARLTLELAQAQSREMALREALVAMDRWFDTMPTGTQQDFDEAGDVDMILKAALAAPATGWPAIYNELVAALDDLVDLQNGPPLAKYEDDWNASMAKARDVLQRAKEA